MFVEHGKVGVRRLVLGALATFMAVAVTQAPAHAVGVRLTPSWFVDRDGQPVNLVELFAVWSPQPR